MGTATCSILNGDSASQVYVRANPLKGNSNGGFRGVYSAFSLVFRKHLLIVLFFVRTLRKTGFYKANESSSREKRNFYIGDTASEESSR